MVVYMTFASGLEFQHIYRLGWITAHGTSTFFFLALSIWLYSGLAWYLWKWNFSDFIVRFWSLGGSRYNGYWVQVVQSTRHASVCRFWWIQVANTRRCAGSARYMYEYRSIVRGVVSSKGWYTTVKWPGILIIGTNAWYIIRRNNFAFCRQLLRWCHSLWPCSSFHWTRFDCWYNIVAYKRLIHYHPHINTWFILSCCET